MDCWTAVQQTIWYKVLELKKWVAKIFSIASLSLLIVPVDEKDIVPVEPPVPEGKPTGDTKALLIVEKWMLDLDLESQGKTDQDLLFFIDNKGNDEVEKIDDDSMKIDAMRPGVNGNGKKQKETSVEKKKDGVKFQRHHSDLLNIASYYHFLFQVALKDAQQSRYGRDVEVLNLRAELKLREAESEAKALHTRTWNRLKIIPLSGDAVDKGLSAVSVSTFTNFIHYDNYALSSATSYHSINDVLSHHIYVEMEV
ncbi:hypothetical protein L1887_06917 [Cichorium endivia]|nr:hypothetical protein L1887_06917 [Cichorium endivia]